MTTRRDFLKTSTSVSVAAAAGMASARELAASPAVVRRGRPAVAVASPNGLLAIAYAAQAVDEGGDVLDGVVHGVSRIERDPDDPSVGVGSLPNMDGVVQLDSSVMHGPTRGAGAVASLEGIATPSLVALDVMRHSDQVLLVGDGAQRFAVSRGHTLAPLLTDRARRRWVEWRTQSPDGEQGLDLPGGHDGVRPLGALHCSMVDRQGNLSGVTTTSGPGYGMPGRVGDSPLVGAGLYVDNDVGACGATGRGQGVVRTCGSHTVVELMRSGVHPVDACIEALRRVVTFTTGPRLLDERGRPRFNVAFYAVNKNGDYGGAALWAGARFAVGVDGDCRHEDSAYLYERRGHVGVDRTMMGVA